MNHPRDAVHSIVEIKVGMVELNYYKILMYVNIDCNFKYFLLCQYEIFKCIYQIYFHSIRQEGSAVGITGPIDFDRNFKTRRNFHMDLIELEHKPFRWLKVAEWNARNGLFLTRSYKELQSQRIASIHNKKFKVVTRLGAPYLREAAPSGSPLTGNDRYEGFIRDLMDEIATVKNFSYEFIVEPNNHLGEYDQHSGKWDGIIGNELKIEKKSTFNFLAPILIFFLHIQGYILDNVSLKIHFAIIGNTNLEY